MCTEHNAHSTSCASAALSDDREPKCCPMVLSLLLQDAKTGQGAFQLLRHNLSGTRFRFWCSKCKSLSDSNLGSKPKLYFAKHVLFEPPLVPTLNSLTSAAESADVVAKQLRTAETVAGQLRNVLA